MRAQVIILLALLLMPSVFAGYPELEDQMSKVFTFVGLTNPDIDVTDKAVTIKLHLPSTFTEQGTLAYLFVNAAAIAPDTETITVEITSDGDAGVVASMNTQTALDFSDGLVSEEEFNSALTIKRIRSAVDVLFMFLTLVVIGVTGIKLMKEVRLKKSHPHIHENHPVHHYMKKDTKPTQRKKKRAKKRRSDCMKLVRDKIPEIINSKGILAITHIAQDEEYVASLHAKLNEEVAEYLESRDDEEIADILEVLIAIAQQKGTNWSTIENIRKEKASTRGSFEKRIILESVKEEKI